ncbi:MAG: CHASE domain-containing protein [Candidatus Andeanibacterium colombiense]|uniref:histidine kinase n=1 Tax=Candidatus Andeanibacterium colombiense TaxID=3121345 RepID=A0AAJ5X858_9SPHN|nr:MAG: CHASE domain-containing protein [Sphingomonadaceae bacterium]
MHRLIIPRNKARRWLTVYPRALPGAIFALVMAVTLLACYALERVEQRSELTQLRERAGAIASALERRANANSSYLRAGAALFATLEQSPATHFRRFVSELRLDADFRGANGIGWAQRVDAAGIPAFDAQVGAEYGQGVQLRPAIARGEPYAVPVTYLEPDNQQNRTALGYNMYSDPVLREAMIEAERTARPSASGMITLQREEQSGDSGFVIFMPVFETVPGGARLRGFVYSAFNARDFLSSALLIAARGELGIRLYDQVPGKGRLMAEIDPGHAEGLTASEDVVIADHHWTLQVTSAEQGLLSPLAMTTLLFGLMVASLLALLVRMLTRQATEDGTRLLWFEQQNAIRDSLTRELNHRVKNTLANVLSIVALTRRRATDLDSFAEGLEGRIRALSATHDLLTRSEWGKTPVRAVIEAELAPYSRELGPSIELSGPNIDLAPNDALSLGLAIHELATNAAKYGALSDPGGRLAIDWQLDGPERARLQWVERGGPPVPAERGRGFGTDLIEKIVAHELKHPVELRFDPEGVTCRLTVPVRAAQPFEIRRR